MTRLLVIVACASLLAACGGEEGPTGNDLPEVATVELLPAADTIEAGSTLQLVAKPRSATEEWLQDRTVSWTSSAPGVATVNGAGLVSAVKGGIAAIIGTADGVSNAATITVVVGVTGTWSGQLELDGTICALTLSLEEELDGSVSGDGFVDLPCIAQSFSVVGLNDAGGVENRVQLVMSLEDGDLAITGDFDGTSSIFGEIDTLGCATVDCSWQVDRTGLNPTPISTLVSQH